MKLEFYLWSRGSARADLTSSRHGLGSTLGTAAVQRRDYHQCRTASRAFLTLVSQTTNHPFYTILYYQSSSQRPHGEQLFLREVKVFINHVLSTFLTVS